MHSDRQRSGQRSHVEARLLFAAMALCIVLTWILGLDLHGSDKPSEKAKLQTGTRVGAGQRPRVSINRATLNELKTLPGVGEATAQRIVEYRSKNPPFRRIEELLIIRGISRNRLEQIRDRIRLD